MKRYIRGLFTLLARPASQDTSPSFVTTSSPPPAQPFKPYLPSDFPLARVKNFTRDIYAARRETQFLLQIMPLITYSQINRPLLHLLHLSWTSEIWRRRTASLEMAMHFTAVQKLQFGWARRAWTWKPMEARVFRYTVPIRGGICVCSKTGLAGGWRHFSSFFRVRDVGGV